MIVGFHPLPQNISESPDDPTAWRTAFSVPKVGLLIIWLRRPLVHGALQLVAPTLLALFGLISIWWQVGLPRRRHSGHVSGA